MSEQDKRSEAVESQSPAPEKAEKKAKAPAKKEKKPNRVLRWLKDLKGELKKVVWPSGKETMKNVGVVIVCVVVVGIFIGVFDLISRQVVDALLNLFT